MSYVLRRCAPTTARIPLPHSLALLGLMLGPACGGDDDPGPDAGTEPLEIVGVWASNFGAEEVITESRFNSADIVEHDNAANLLITRNSTAAEFNPGLFNRIQWIDLAGDTFYYCFVEFGLPSAEAARTSTTSADPSEPDDGGCGGFPWTRLRRAISIRGRYLSNFGGMETITATVWNQLGFTQTIVDWDEGENWVVTQSPELDPSTFNRIEFTEPGSMGAFHYCTVDFGLATADQARTSTRTADPSGLETDGCGGFPWTRLDPL